MNTKQTCLLCLLLLGFPLCAIDFSFSYRQGFDIQKTDLLTEKLGASFSHSGKVFDLSLLIDIGNEGPYPKGFQEVFFGPFSVDLAEGGMGLRLDDFHMRAGVYPHRDIVDSPYSLFINGNGPSAPILEISFEDSRFLFTNRWIGLNVNSAFGWPDRGAVQKNYALVLGNLRVGFQDLAVFSTASGGSSRYFDINYFLSPLPSYFVQYIASSSVRPWAQDTNDNSIMGFFGDYKGESWYAYTQLLVDDLNMNRFLDPGSFQNPDKIAWSLGGRYDSPYGSVSLYHAGATAYVFEPYGSENLNTKYGYSYYPADSFMSAQGVVPVAIEDNMTGYQHGENNLAFLASWEKRFFVVDNTLQAEFTLSGSKSAGNPWHEYRSCEAAGMDTHFLDDPVLERKLLISGICTYEWREFAFNLDYSFGYVWNRLALRLVDSDDSANLEPFFSPSNENAYLCRIGLSCIWKPNFVLR